MWMEPVANGIYVIGADCSAGVVSFSAAVVLNEYNDVCATYNKKVDPTAFDGVLNELGKKYNTAQLVVERNAQGYSVLASLVDVHRYPN